MQHQTARDLRWGNHERLFFPSLFFFGGFAGGFTFRICATASLKSNGIGGTVVSLRRGRAGIDDLLSTMCGHLAPRRAESSVFPAANSVCRYLKQLLAMLARAKCRIHREHVGAL